MIEQLEPGDMVSVRGQTVRIRYATPDNDFGVVIKYMPVGTVVMFVEYVSGEDLYDYLGAKEGEISACLLNEQLVHVASKYLYKIDNDES